MICRSVGIIRPLVADAVVRVPRLRQAPAKKTINHLFDFVFVHDVFLFLGLE